MASRVLEFFRIFNFNVNSLANLIQEPQQLQSIERDKVSISTAGMDQFNTAHFLLFKKKSAFTSTRQTVN